MSVGASELAKTVGVSYRQIDHWSRHGYIHPANPRPGSGQRRWFSDTEARRVQVFAVLTHLGMSPVGAHDVLSLGWFDDAELFHSDLHVREVTVHLEVQL